jgi:hypothetical protein
MDVAGCAIRPSVAEPRARSSLVSNDGIMSFFATSVKLATKGWKSGN